MNLINQYYYIVHFKDFLKPVLYPIFFTNKKAAQRAIRKTVAKNKRTFYEIVKGSKLKEFEFKFVLQLGRMGKFTKYDYPPELQTIQKRKTFRTVMRRRLRRMGMLTHIKNKYPASQGSTGVIKLIQNRQEVANTPNTSAMVFRLERREKNTFFVILKKHISKKRGVLFEVKALVVNVKTGTIKKQKINVLRNDIIIPYLLVELFKLYEKETYLLDKLRNAGLRLNYSQPE